MTMIVTIILLSVSSVLCQGPTITLPDGKIEGLQTKTIRNKLDFYAYLGIPFAAPPVGQLRMKPPQPVEPWNETFQATSNKKICYQISDKIHSTQYEDCLILNVYTPVKPGESGDLPVMVSIYGGSFTHGFASFGTTGPDYLIENGIIVVTFNYRVGPFGFISTMDETIPGNMGVKDQVFALNWVQKNIHIFGGDPNKVTIQGQSAGAASVTYHVLSPASAGLFRAAIANSGSALDSWVNSNTNALHVATSVARIIDPSLGKQPSPKEIYDVLMKADAEDIHQTGKVYSAYAPVLEGNHDGAFITESMYELVKTGRFNRVPLMIGFNSEEYISLAASESNLLALAKKFDNNVESLVNRDMNANSSLLTEIGEIIKNTYTGGIDFQATPGAAIRFKSDDFFVRGVIRHAQLQAQYTDVYMYQFSYHGQLGNNNNSYEGCGRVQHGEEGHYLWAGADLNTVPESDVQTVERYVGFFSNFIKHMNPTPKEDSLFQNVIWSNLNPEDLNYLDIDQNLTIQTSPRNGVFEKWLDIYDKYSQEPLLSW